jgi:hypothetical protein
MPGKFLLCYLSLLFVSQIYQKKKKKLQKAWGAGASGTWGERSRWTLQPGRLHNAPICMDNNQRGFLGVQAVPDLKGCPTRLEGRRRTPLLGQLQTGQRHIT